MLAIATILLPTFSKSPPLLSVLDIFTSNSDIIETVAFEIALSIPSLWRWHAVTITVLEEAAQAFLYLVKPLLEPNFSDFHDIVHSSKVAVMVASGRKRIPWLECGWVNLIPWVIG